MCDCECGGCSNKLPEDRLNELANSTRTLVAVLKYLTEKDFDRFLGAGVRVQLQFMDGEKLVPEFMVGGEVMKEISAPLSAAIKDTLSTRQLLLEGEINTIKNTLAKPGEGN